MKLANFHYSSLNLETFFSKFVVLHEKGFISQLFYTIILKTQKADVTPTFTPLNAGSKRQMPPVQTTPSTCFT